MNTFRTYRRTVLAGCTAVALAGGLATGGKVAGDGALFDLTLAVRALLISGAASTDDDRVAVIVLDRRSLGAPELAAVPRVFLGPYWARLLDGVMAARARAVGFDVIFGYSASRFLPGHERDFLASLNRHRQRVVLARSGPTPVAMPFFFAIGAGQDPGGLGFAELTPDPGGVYRRVPIRFDPRQDGERPSFVAALLARAGLTVPAEPILLAPRRPLEAIPAYSMIDVLRCADADPAALAQVFADRILLIGTSLAEEDRRVSVDRYMRTPAADARPPPDAPGCELARAGASDPSSGTVPGVFVHAAAVSAVAQARLVGVVPSGAIALMTAAAAAVGAMLAFVLRPWTALAVMLAAQSGLFVLGVAMLSLGQWLPWASAGAALAGSVAVSYVARYLFEERRRSRLQRAFGHYLAPSLVARLAESETALQLGGETREVTVMFADLVGFTAASARLEPHQLMRIANRYLGIVAEIVDAGGGYVDKFIGDSVMAIWGAPAAATDHAVRAVAASRRAAAAVLRERAADEARGEPGFVVRIGLNSGAAIVGNVGTARRFNFTAVGEPVNLAARLEAMPDDYGCYLVIGPAAARAVGDRFLLSELDRVRLKGVSEPLAVFEPLAELADATAAQTHYAEGYAAALEAYRAHRFTEAAAGWRALAYPGPSRTGAGGDIVDPPRVMAARAADYARRPSAEDWDGVWTRKTG